MGKLAHIRREVGELLEAAKQLEKDIWIPARCCRTDRIKTNKQLRTVLKNENIRTKRHGQHLFVHGLEWLHFLAAPSGTRPPTDDEIDNYLVGVEERKNAARHKKPSA